MPEPTPKQPVADRSPAAPADDDLDELPPMDGADEGEPEAEPEEIDALEDAGDPLDDSTGEGDPVDASEIDAHGGESGWLDDAEDADALDLGASELASFEEAGAHDPKLDFEEPGVEGEDFGLGGDEAAAELDAGDEGPIAADEDLKEADLPQLDADEEGEVDDAELIEAGFAEDAIPRAAEAWKTVGAPLDVGPVLAIACAGRGVVVATERGLVRVDLEGACEPLGGEGIGAPIAKLAAERDLIAAVTAAGELVVSRDGGRTFRSSWRERASLATGGACDVAFAEGALWTRTRGGAVLRSTDGGVAWEIASDVPAPFASPPTVAGADAVAALDARTVVAAMYREAEDTTALVRIDGTSRTVVAEVSGDAEADGRVVALVVDDAHGVVWAGGAFGLLAFEPGHPLS